MSSDHPISVELKPRTMMNLDVDLRGGTYQEIRIEAASALKRGAFVKAVPVNGAELGPDPNISDSGEPFVRIPVLPAQNTVAHLQVTALTNSKSDTVPLSATITLMTEDATPQAEMKLKALRAFAHAERVRRERGKAADAMPPYQEALAGARALHDPVFEQRILVSMARFLDLDGSHYADAIPYAKQATEIDTEATAPTVSAFAWKALGGAYLDMDRDAESIEASKHAADLYRKTGTTFWLGIVLENVTDAYMTKGNLDAALPVSTEALEIARTLKDDYGIIEMLSQIGAIHQDRGEYQEALNNFTAAVELSLPSQFNPMQGDAWADLGELYTVLGENDRALDAYGHALGIAQSTRNGLTELGTLEHMGRLELDNGKREDAAATFAKALARAEELKLVRQQSGLLADLARAESGSGKQTAAAEHVRKALALAEEIHQPYEQGDALTVRAELEQADRRADAAEADLRQASEIWQKLPDNERLAKSLSQLAELEIGGGQMDQANGHLTQAIALIESSRNHLARGGLRTQYFALHHHTYDLAVFTAMQLDKARPDAGYAAKAWETAERAKARSLLDSYAGENVAETGAENDPLRERLTAVGRQIEDTQDHIAQLGTSADDLEKAAKLQAALHQSLMEEQELESRLASSESHDAALTETMTPAAFAKAALTPKSALLEYWEGERSSYLWLIGADGSVHAAALPAAKRLREMTTDYQRDLLARNTSAANEDFVQRMQRVTTSDARLDRQARLLYETLVPLPIRKPISGDETLLLVSDGSLLSLPFTALEAPGAKPYLIQRFHIVSEPSAAAIAAAAPMLRTTDDQGRRIAIFADPVYSRSDDRLQHKDEVAGASEGVTRGGSDLDLTHLPRLPGSRQEAMSIASIAGTQNASLHMGLEATPAAVKTLDWKTYPVAHFAAHAVASVNVPETSGIVLSMVDGSGQNVDGMLWLRDIRRLHLASELVVLSGCGTALGENIPGEGLNSLSRAFLESGTRDVTATLWSADDAAASALMQSFYRHLLDEHLAPPAALRAAQLEMLADTRHHAPYYWAGFVMEGAWREQ